MPQVGQNSWTQAILLQSLPLSRATFLPAKNAQEFWSRHPCSTNNLPGFLPLPPDAPSVPVIYHYSEQIVALFETQIPLTRLLYYTRTESLWLTYVTTDTVKGSSESMPGAHSLCPSTPQGPVLKYWAPQCRAFKSPVLLKDSGVIIASCMFSPAPLQPFPLVSDTVVGLGTLALWSPFPASMGSRTLRTRWLSACDGLCTQCLDPLQSLDI